MLDALGSAFNSIWGVFKSIGLNDLVDIAILSFLIYNGIKLVRETRAQQLIKGILVLIVCYIIAVLINLQTIRFILKICFQWGFLALIILFQPELRRMLEKVGRTKISEFNFFNTTDLSDIEEHWTRAIDAICDACQNLSSTKTGALIICERKTKLGEQIATGTVLNCLPSAAVFGNIFYPNTPLHDGAVIIRNGIILAAGCFLPRPQKDELINKQLEELKKQAEQAENELKNQKAPYYYQFDRFELSSDYSSFYGDSQKIDSISKVFPVFFILVAALVCLTTMTRMVEEQRTQIGTYKAMGYSGTTIAAKYLIYSSVASLTGSCIGSVVGMQVLPAIIYSCYKILYNIPVLKTPFKPDYVLACALVSVVCTAGAVLYACIRELRSQPSQLMRPKPPHSGKRVVLEKIGFIWNRLSFLGKVTLRNLFRYKKRFLMTLIGVAGCTALIVTGFGLKYSIKSIVSKQFSEYFVYDAFVVMNSGGFSEQQLDKKISSIDGIDKYMFTQQSEGTAENGNKTQTASMVVMKTPEEMSDYVKLIDTESGQKIALDDGSAVITEKLADLLKLEPGDDMTVKMNSHKTVNVKIKAVSENYTNHYIYITPDTYKKLYGEEPTYNLSFVNLKENIDENSFKEQLIANDEFYGMSYKSDSSKGFLDSVDSLNAIVVVLIVCAGALAVVVLYNLANINITERIREIATLKVLGFYDTETSEYICRENYISAVLGILLGFGLGKILHHFVVVTSEVDIVMFNRSLVWWAYVLAAVMTMAFTVLVNLILHFKLKKVDMVESLKSVE